MDGRVEIFLEAVLSLEGTKEIHNGVRMSLAECEGLFRDAEAGAYNREKAGQHCRQLCRERVIEEIGRCKGTGAEARLKIALKIIETVDELSRFPPAARQWRKVDVPTCGSL